MFDRGAGRDRLHSGGGSRPAVMPGIILIMIVGAVAVFEQPGARAEIYQSGVVSSISAASFEPAEVAPESIVAAFGTSLANQTVIAGDVDPATPGIQLPTDLGGTTVEVNGRRAELFFISPNQVNYVIPPQTEDGAADVVVRAGNGAVSNGTVETSQVAPGIFTANASGGGVPAAILLRVKTDGSQVFEDLIQFSPELGQFIPRPISLGPAGERVFIILFLTGTRKAEDPNGDGNRNEKIRILIGGTEVVPAFAGNQPDFVGLDQINVEIPRSLIGRGQVDVAVVATDFSASNLVNIEIAGDTGSSPPTVSGFGAQTALAGQEIVINGSGFSAVASENLVKIGGVDAEVMEATSSQLKIAVPFGVGTGPVQVRTLTGEGASQQVLQIRTSISGLVENTVRQPMAGVTVRIPDLNITATTNEEGAFVLPDVPPGVQLVEVRGSSLDTGPPYPNVSLKIAAQGNRDNLVSRPIALQQATGSGGTVGSDGSFSAKSSGGADDLSIIDQVLPVSILTGDFRLEFPANPRVLFPTGATRGSLFLTPLRNARTPVNLPFRYFSSSIVQITPFNVKLDPGGKLVFPNTDNFQPGEVAALFRYDSELGKFVREEASARVSADGQRIETEAMAIRISNYYFAAALRKSTTIVGRVLRSDGVTPATRVLVGFRGQEAFTDGNGSFVLRYVPVRPNETISIELSYLWPSGRVEKIESPEFTAVAGGVSRMPDVILPSRRGNRPPNIVAPESLIIDEGQTYEGAVYIYDTDPQQSVVSTSFTGPSFAVLSGDIAYGRKFSLKLTPGYQDAGQYQLTINAMDNLGAVAVLTIKLVVNNVR